MEQNTLVYCGICGLLDGMGEMNKTTKTKIEDLKHDMRLLQEFFYKCDTVNIPMAVGACERIMKAVNMHQKLVEGLQDIADGNVMKDVKSFTHAEVVEAYQKKARAILAGVEQ